MSNLRANSPIQYVKGVGPARARAFADLGILTVADLLDHLPFRYERDSGEVSIGDLQPETIATVRGVITRVGRSGPSLTARLEDTSDWVRLRWFHHAHGRQGVYVGANVLATGKVQEYNDRLEIVQPRVHVFTPHADVRPAGLRSRWIGVYRATEQLPSGLIRRAVETVLASGAVPIADPLPRALLEKHGMAEREQAVRDAHAPATHEAAERARRRLAYEELFLVELAMALRRRKRVSTQKGQRCHVTPEIDRRIRRRFPFGLTAAQSAVIADIARDLQSGRPMTRLLQGDVGSGKTVVALYACLVAIANRRQAAIMTPTELLAQQHFRNISQYLDGSRVRSALLHGGLSRSERLELLQRIAEGKIDLVVGTQALIQQDVAFDKLALVVVDEQHKFGVLQRHTFRTKGPMPHYLVMTATPIPRTLSMTIFGDLDVSIIDHAPPGRGRVRTRVVAPVQVDPLLRELRGRLERGEQAYFVCPLVGEDGESAPFPDDGARGFPQSMRPGEACGPVSRLASAKQVHERLSRGAWSGLRIGLLYGAMKPADKEAVIQAFSRGELHALVSTTVVEVGVDVPAASLMVVENAERFGLSQLHQLRGRIGRGPRDGECALIARSGGESARQRLGVMAQTTDGFRIAEADLRQRGPGELLGTRQHGLPEMRVANLVDDFELLELARRDAFELARTDPDLCRPEHAGLMPALQRLFGEKLALIDAA